MNTTLTVKTPKRKKLASLLGLALDGSRLSGVVLRRNDGSLQLQQSFDVTLSLDPLTAAPELVGREIRNHLDSAGVRERNCVVGVPLKWVLTAQTELPNLPAADAAGLLEMETERGFPCDVATLRLTSSSCALKEGKQLVTMAGIPNSQLALLESVLMAAKLRPVSFALGLQALQPPTGGKSDGVLALLVGETQVALQITSGGGVAALRGLEGAIENESGQAVLHAGLVSREARITLGQLPAEVSQSVKRIRIFGPRQLAQQLADEMELRFEPMGLTVEVVSAYRPEEFGVNLPPGASLSPAFSLAAWPLAGQFPVFEFLPPKPTLLQQLATKYSSGRLQTIGAAAVLLVLLLAGVLALQQFELVKLRSQWAGMSGKVADLTSVQGLIVQYQPWFDDTFQDLSILRQLTVAFPEDGTVTAKTIEVRDGNIVSCTGTARDNTALLRTLGQLRDADNIFNLKVEEIRGKSPMQFTFEFQWGNGNANGGDNEN
jgi:hypothetical protein